MSSLKEKYPVLVARATTDPKAARMLELLATAERAFAQRACTRIESRKRREHHHCILVAARVSAK